MVQISREQLELLRQKNLRPVTPQDELNKALQSPLEQLEQQHQSLEATATQIAATYAQTWQNILIQFTFKLVEQMNLDLSEQMNEEQIKSLNTCCINAVTAAELLTEQLRHRETIYKEVISKDAPIPETLKAGIALIQEEINKKKVQERQLNEMSLEKINGNESTIEDIDDTDFDDAA